MSTILDELRWRDLIVSSTGIEELEAALAAGPIGLYCGFDPTASSLHVGHLMQVVTLCRFQRAGHRVHALVGGATGLIGDPRMSGERVLNTEETVAGWVNRLQEQLGKLFASDPEHEVTMVNNLDWTREVSALELLRDIGKNFRMGTMLSREIVASRLNGEGLSYTEFSYQILQAMDFLELFRRNNVTLQCGGTDQWGNFLGGVELIRKIEGAEVHALTTPLVTKADGTKFGKTEGGAVWLDPELTSPFAFYQFWLNADDRDVVKYLKCFTFRNQEQIADLERATAERPHAREAQRALAADMTDFVHGEQARRQVEAAAAVLFGKGKVTDLDAGALELVAREVPTIEVSVGDALADAFVSAEIVPSKSAVRRSVKEGGLSVNGERVVDPEGLVEESHRLPGDWVLLRRGRKTTVLAKLK